MNPLGIEKRPLEPAPEKNAAVEYAVAAAKVGGLALPFLGPFATLFDLMTANLRGQRLADWQESLRVGFNELSERVNDLTPEKLVENEAFVSALAQATQSAMKTHQEEKLEALRNAVLNVATGNAPSDDRQVIFLNLVDRLTPSHLHILAHLKDRAATPRPKMETDLSNQVMLDLNAAGLLKDGRPFAARDRDYADLLNVGATWTVNSVGKQFLEFIESPISN